MHLAPCARNGRTRECGTPACVHRMEPEPEWRVKTRGYKVGCFNAGRADGAYVLSVAYKPKRAGKAERVGSNDPAYGKTWPTRQVASQPENVEAFLRWVEGRGQGGGGGHSKVDHAALETLIARRQAAQKAVKAKRFAAIIAARVEAAGGHLVEPKPRGGKISSEASILSLGINRPLFTRTNHKLRARKTKRRQDALVKASARASSDAEWLGRQVEHLAWCIAYRQPQALLPEGDYSDSQLDRAAQQACILHSFYSLLLQQKEAVPQVGAPGVFEFSETPQDRPVSTVYALAAQVRTRRPMHRWALSAQPRTDNLPLHCAPAPSSLPSPLTRAEAPSARCRVTRRCRPAQLWARASPSRTARCVSGTTTTGRRACLMVWVC